MPLNHDCGLIINIHILELLESFRWIRRTFHFGRWAEYRVSVPKETKNAGEADRSFLKIKLSLPPTAAAPAPRCSHDRSCSGNPREAKSFEAFR
ncbi:MAG: hypothetical protein DMG06_16585 [Acidobacteria bacterium]|nr:MAG: hypothetical protein DMG06_16585 [Acidobacteriota bacterium]